MVRKIREQDALPLLPANGIYVLPAKAQGGGKRLGGLTSVSVPARLQLGDSCVLL